MCLQGINMNMTTGMSTSMTTGMDISAVTAAWNMGMRKDIKSLSYKPGAA